jgi:hypothetical protein
VTGVPAAGELVVRRCGRHLVNNRGFVSALIKDSIKLQMREFLEWFALNHPDEQLYAVLVDVPDVGDAANIIAASDQSLEEHARKVRRRGESADAVRDALRWDAPGEGDGWYWPEHDGRNGTTHLIRLAIDRGLLTEYDGKVRQLVGKALGELERAGAFGTGRERNRLFVGCMNVHEDFEETVDGAVGCNPAAVVKRVRREIARA